MTKWQPDANEHQARRIGKTLEELGELAAVLARISIQGIDEVDPSSGETNRRRMLEETADVLVQLALNVEAFSLSTDDLDARIDRKMTQMVAWERHFK